MTSSRGSLRKLKKDVFKLPAKLSGSLHIRQVEGLAHVLQVGNLLAQVESNQLPQGERNSPRCQVYSHTDVLGGQWAFKCKALQYNQGTSGKVDRHLLYHMFLLGGFVLNCRLPSNIRELFTAYAPQLGVDTLVWNGKMQETEHPLLRPGDAAHRLKDREESTPPCESLSR